MQVLTPDSASFGGVVAFPIYVHLKRARYQNVLSGRIVNAPPDPIYYVLARNGLFQKKNGFGFEALVKIWETNGKKLDWLAGKREYFKIILPKKMEREIPGQATGFFREVFSKFRTEAGLIMYWDSSRHIYELFCPKQETTYASVDYKILPTVLNKIRVATIHSHCDFSAFHSGTDCEDELNEDGFHITIGNIMSRVPSISCSLAVDGKRAGCDVSDIFETPLLISKADRNFPKDWLEAVRVKEVSLPSKIMFASPVKEDIRETAAS